MDVLGTVINATVVAAVGLVLAWLAKGQFESFARQFEAVARRFDAVDHRIDRLEERLEHRIDTLQASVDAMRSDLTQVALAVGARPRATNG
ncbi:MAG TPA: hypothetical protein VF984_07910 [Actinomycetota bacterium]